MEKMIQIRHVPAEIHRVLKARAAMAGMSLSDYLLDEVRRIATRPTLQEMKARLRKLSPVTPDISAAQTVREERDNR